MIERIKVLLGLQDDLQDDLLGILTENVRNTLSAKLEKDVPEELNYIIEEITIRRYNRVGTEGMKSERVEGHRVEFYDLDDEFKPYEDVIAKHVEGDNSLGKGKVMFF